MRAGAGAVVEASLLRYRRTWRASVFSSFLNPILLLLAMGLGLGSLVEEGPAGLPYLEWLAPGLLAGVAMQTAVGESSYPVMGALRWSKTFEAALATPLGVADLVRGHLFWVTARTAQVTVVFAVVMTAFGVGSPAGNALAAVVAVGTGLAFAGLVTAYTASLRTETGLPALFRFGVVPLFLFSGTYFPVSSLPEPARTLAAASPLYHGAELARAAALGLPTVYPVAVHVGVLVVVGAAGARLAGRILTRRLVR